MRGRILLAWSGLAACFNESDPVGSGSGNDEDTSAQTSDPSTSSASDPSSSSTTASTATTADTSGEADESTGSPTCGNDMVEPDEDCDDGNDIPGDGCSRCRASGTLLFRTTVGTPGLRDDCFDVAIGDEVIAAGNLGDGPDDNHGWVSSFADDGVPSWRFDDDDALSSGFRAIAWIDDEELVAVGIRNNVGLLVGDGWAKRFTAGGVSGVEQELTWHIDSGLSGFVGVTVVDSELLLTASVAIGSSLHAWYGQLPLSVYPTPTFSVESYGTVPGTLVESFARGTGASPPIRGTVRTATDGPDAITLVGFDGAIADPPPWSTMVESSDQPVKVAVDGTGQSWVCSTSDGGDPQLLLLSPTFDILSSQSVPLGGPAACNAIVAVDGGVVIGATMGGLPLVAELDATLAVVWSSPLDGAPAQLRSIALAPAGDRVAICGVRPEDGSRWHDAFVAAIVR